MTTDKTAPDDGHSRVILLHYWRQRGLGPRAATAAAATVCRSRNDIRRLGWRFFGTQKNGGRSTLAELSDFVGGWPDPPSKRDVWIRHASDDFLVNELRRRSIVVVICRPATSLAKMVSA